MVCSAWWVVSRKSGRAKRLARGRWGLPGGPRYPGIDRQERTGLLVVLPSWLPALAGYAKDPLIERCAIANEFVRNGCDMQVPALQRVVLASWVGADNMRLDLSQIERIECPVKQKHFGVTAKTFASEPRIANACAGCCGTVDPPNAV